MVVEDGDLGPRSENRPIGDFQCDILIVIKDRDLDHATRSRADTLGADRYSRALSSCIGNFHELLSEVLAGKQAEQRFRRALQAVRDILLVHEAAISLPS